MQMAYCQDGPCVAGWPVKFFVPLPPNLWVISKANSLSLMTEVRRKDFFRLLKVVHDGPLREWA